MRTAPAPSDDARRLFVGAAVGLGAVVVLSAVTVASYVSAAQWLDHAIEVRLEVHDWQAAVLDAQAGVRGYVATGKASFLDPYTDAVAREKEKSLVLRGLVSENPVQVLNVREADRDADVVMDDLRELVALVHTRHPDDAVAKLESPSTRDHVEQFRRAAHALRAEEDAQLTSRRTSVMWRGRAALLGAVFLALASAALLWLGWRRERTHLERTSQLASSAQKRLRALSELAAVLSAAKTTSEVVDIIVEHGTRAVEADTCTLYALDATSKGLDLIGHRGVASDVITRIQRISESSGNPIAFETMKTGKSAWVENEEDYARVYPALAAIRADGPRAKAFWSMPLVAEGRPLGLMGVGYYAPRAFLPEERAFIQTLAQHCAQALLRASRLDGEYEAQRWLETTLRSIGDAVIATDAEGRVTFMNPVAEVLTGWTEADARERPLSDVFCIFSEITRAPVESPVTKVLREGAVVGLANHTVLRSKGGHEVPIDDSGAPIRNESGKIRGVVLVFRNVTAEKTARARTEFLAKAGEALVGSIDYQATLATIARFAVPTLADWCAVTLLEAGSDVPRQVAVAHADESKIRFARELGERYPSDPESKTGVPEVIRSGKSELYAEISPALLEARARDADHARMIRALSLRSAMIVPLRVHGRTFGAMTFVYAESGRRYSEDDLAFAEDFSRRAAMAIENALALKDTERSREQERILRGEAELASRAKDDFLATVSHELRTPLNAILGWTVMLRQKAPPPETDRALGIVERNARLQKKLIEDVLDISRIISGKLALNVGPTNVNDVTRAAIETVTPAAEAKEITFDVELLEGAATITGDADRIQQIVWNLLSNAVKFTPRGGHVKVSVARDEGHVSVRVKDSGEGIRGEFLPSIFEPFHQADASITRRHGGLGLGLAIVKQLVSAHGGTVRAESEGEGKGAAFVVRLPAAMDVPYVPRREPLGTSASVVTPELSCGPRLDGLKVLVVDDEADTLEFVSHALAEQGAEVFIASSADAGMERFRERRPDVVVSDLGMPNVDGFAFIRRIRALRPEEGGRTPAVALTAYARAEDAERAFAAGFQRHVTKPVEPSLLATVVANLGGRTTDPTGDEMKG